MLTKNIEQIKCSCRSTNKPEWGGSVRPVVMNGVEIDACIVPQIEELWRMGIKTAHSCCGHNLMVPEIGLLDYQQVEKACDILSRIDTRTWRVWVYNNTFFPSTSVTGFCRASRCLALMTGAA